MTATAGGRLTRTSVGPVAGEEAVSAVRRIGEVLDPAVVTLRLQPPRRGGSDWPRWNEDSAIPFGPTPTKTQQRVRVEEIAWYGVTSGPFPFFHKTSPIPIRYPAHPGGGAEGSMFRIAAI